jgi:C-terminal processing protease CtpA/Prc
MSCRLARQSKRLSFQRLIRGAVLLAFAALSTFGADLPSSLDRVIATGKLWLTVKYFHPSLAYRDLDWDQAFVDAVPKIRAAQSSAEYEAAVQSMLRPLDGVASQPAAGQRVWIHHGLPPETGEPSAAFYSAFLYKTGTVPDEVSVPMGGFNVRVALSEPASSLVFAVQGQPRVYADPFPSSELRALAAFKIWGVFHYFFAYRDLMDEDWDALLPQFLPRLLAAKDALEYNLTIAEWLTHAADSFAQARSETLTNYFGEAPVGLRLRIVEKHVVVTEILDPAASQSGVKIGDIIKAVDNETLVNRFKRESQYVPASTPQRQAVDVITRILNGKEGSAAQLTMEDPAGVRKDVSLKRSRRFAELLNATTPGEPSKLLRDGIGYADLTRLKTSEVDAMFEKFRNARAIIFDMRGEPAEDSFSAVAARLSSEPDIPAAIVTGSIVAVPDLPQGSVASPSSSYFFVQTISNSSQWKYKNRTVMLVDERTINAGERAGLFLEAANKTEFVGAPTAGAYSVVTNFTIPGGVTISLSGQDIRHANGGKLQRLGLQPNLNAAPTLAGIRNGKDEVLEKALDFLFPKATNPKTLPTRAGTFRDNIFHVYSIQREKRAHPGQAE